MKEPRKGDSLIVAHARRELELAGAFKKTDDYDGFMGPAILSLVKTFDSWSKGDGAKMQILHQAFNTLIAGELLAPPTDDPDEWQRVNRENGNDVLRNLRSPFYVSTDGGKSWRNTATGETGRSRNHITGEDPKPEEEAANVKRSTTNIGDAIEAGDPEGAQAENASASDGRNDEAAGEPTGNEGSSEAAPNAEGRSVDSGVAPESTEGESQPQESSSEPEGGEKK